MSRKPLGIGVVGTGGMGTRHIHNLISHVPDADVLAIMDVDEARTAQVRSTYGIEKIYTDPIALIGDSDVDALVIASPDK